MNLKGFAPEPLMEKVTEVLKDPTSKIVYNSERHGIEVYTPDHLGPIIALNRRGNWFFSNQYFKDLGIDTKGVQRTL